MWLVSRHVNPENPYESHIYRLWFTIELVQICSDSQAALTVLSAVILNLTPTFECWEPYHNK